MGSQLGRSQGLDCFEAGLGSGGFDKGGYSMMMAERMMTMVVML